MIKKLNKIFKQAFLTIDNIFGLKKKEEVKDPCKWLSLTIRNQDDGTIHVIGRCIKQNLKNIGPVCGSCKDYEVEKE